MNLREPNASLHFSVHCWLIILVLGTLGLGSEISELRVWKDSTGRYEVKATLIRLGPAQVHLKREDGTVVTVPIERLSSEDQRYIAKLHKDNPFALPDEPTPPKPAAAAQAVVIVAVERSGAEYLSIGYVFRRDHQYAYVAMNPVPSLASATLGSQTAEETFTIFWGGEERNAVAGKCLARFRQKGKWIVAAAVDKMPPEILLEHEMKLSDSSPVWLAGYNIDTRSRPQSFARISTGATAARVFRTSDGASTKVIAQHSAIGDLTGALAITLEGEVVGYVSQSTPARDGAKGTATVIPIDFLSNIEEPEVSGIRFAPKSGDEKHINYQFEVTIEDPFDKINSPRLRILPYDDPPSPTLSNPSNLEERFKDAKEVKLVEDELDETVEKQLLRMGGPMTGTRLVGNFTTENPGPQRYYRMTVQLCYESEEGELLCPITKVIGYSPSMFPRRGAGDQTVEDVVPDIPGFDGMPLDVPRYVQHQDGGYLITSEKTRAEQPPVTETREFPKPQASKEPRGGRSYAAGEFQAVKVLYAQQPKSRFSGARAPMVYSADGKYLYLVDGKYLLRKLRSDDLVQEAFLETGLPCDEITLSKAGLVIVLNDANSVWVIDENSLDVLREITIPRARLVAANLSTNIGFVSAGSRFGSLNSSQLNLSKGFPLHMIDFEKGEVLHTIQEQYGIYRPLANGVPPIDGLLSAMRMSSDGGNLFTGASSIRRFRVVGEDLIYEQTSPPVQNSHTTFFGLSADGRWVTMPTEGAPHGQGYNVHVFPASDLSTPKLILERAAFPGTVDWDPKTGKIYSPHYKNLNIFSEGGAKLTSFPHGLDDTRRIIVDPQDQGFVLWGSEEMVVFNTRSE